jgi:pimeloyl-ACP methyl ester carboxylesterase
MTLKHVTTSDGLRLCYEDRGTGTPLLCLAGLTRNMDDFRPILVPLAGRCRIIRLDARGRGLSERAADFTTYNVLREGQDVLELLDHLGLHRAVVLGTSRGGLVAMALAAGHADRLAAVILNDIGPVIGTSGLARIMDYVGRTPASETLDTAAEAAHRFYATEFPGVPLATWREQVAHWYDEGPEGLVLRYDPQIRTALLHQSAAGAAPDMWMFFEALKALPLAAIRGANSDILSAETLAEMQRRHPGMRAVTVPDRGHVPFLDEPESLAAIEAMLAAGEARMEGAR